MIRAQHEASLVLGIEQWCHINPRFVSRVIGWEGATFVEATVDGQAYRVHMTEAELLEKISEASR